MASGKRTQPDSGAKQSSAGPAQERAAPARALFWPERFRLAWEMVWPATAIDAAWEIFAWVAGIDSKLAFAVSALSGFFVVETWVVRRAIRHAYGSFSLSVGEDVDDPPHRMTYQESLSVVWLLTWRVTVLSIAALLVTSLVCKVLSIPLAQWFSFASGSPLGNALGITAVDFITGLAFFPLLIRGMIRKEYRAFRIRIERPRVQRPASARLRRD